MILHLLQDEKITNRMISNFEETLPGQNIFLCIIPYQGYKLRHINSNIKNIILQVEGAASVIDCSKVNKVFIHFLTLSKIEFCNKYINQSAIIYWGLWGADLYNKLLYGRGYRLYASINYRSNLVETLLDILRTLKHRFIYDKQYVEFINKRVKYIGGLKCDFDLAYKYLRASDKEFFTLSGYAIDEILGPYLVDKMVDSENSTILCGNSASYTNNHKYVIKYLKKLVDEGSPVKMILSYGGDENYVHDVIKYAKRNLGQCFMPITEFLPLDQYNQLMCSSRICVYGSWRQEAVGNIIVSLYLGAKVYISKHSPLLKELRSAGYKVFILEEANRDTFYEKLDYKTQMENRAIAISTNSQISIIRDIKKFFCD